MVYRSVSSTTRSRLISALMPVLSGRIGGSLSHAQVGYGAGVHQPEVGSGGMQKIEGSDDRALVLDGNQLQALRWGAVQNQVPVTELSAGKVLRDDKGKTLGMFGGGGAGPHRLRPGGTGDLDPPRAAVRGRDLRRRRQQGDRKHMKRVAPRLRLGAPSH